MYCLSCAIAWRGTPALVRRLASLTPWCLRRWSLPPSRQPTSRLCPPVRSLSAQPETGLNGVAVQRRACRPRTRHAPREKPPRTRTCCTTGTDPDQRTPPPRGSLLALDYATCALARIRCGTVIDLAFCPCQPGRRLSMPITGRVSIVVAPPKHVGDSEVASYNQSAIAWPVLKP